jgi:hypothetical protein
MTVKLNGTDTNPFHLMGLKSNPFPQLARAETDAQVRRLEQLGADPIPDTDYIRNHLRGWVSQELIDGCCERFKKGEMAEFDITWKE